MSAVPEAKRPPYFRTEVETYVDVDISPEELESAGWVYVGTKKKLPGEPEPITTERVIEAVVRWHDANHDAPWRWCRHELCDQLRGRHDA